MHQLSYFVILHEGRTDSLDLINPRFLVEGHRNRFLYEGPDPAFWRGLIQKRHGLISPFEVMWERGRQPSVPSEDYSDEPDDCSSVVLAGS